MNRIGLTPLARQMKIPISTLDGWKREDRIPGTGASKQWREALFWEAVTNLEGQDSLRRQDAAPDEVG